MRHGEGAAALRTTDIQLTNAEQYDWWYCRWHRFTDCNFPVPAWRPSLLWRVMRRMGWA